MLALTLTPIKNSKCAAALTSGWPDTISRATKRLVERSNGRRTPSEVHQVPHDQYFPVLSDQSVFAAIADHILPAITTGGNMPRIWSAGCSIGAEIYSIALLLTERGLRARELLATDIDEAILARAREGRFTESEVGNVPPEMLQRIFSESEHQYVIDARIRRMVSFARHDLLRDPYPKPFDLILCRNVFIYFTADTQQRLIRSFVSSLRPGGFFVVGSARTHHGSRCLWPGTSELLYLRQIATKGVAACMNEWIGSAATIEEAIAKGLQELGAAREDVEIEVLEVPKKRFLGLAKGAAR